MLQKLLSIALGVAIIGQMFFRPQLKRLGQRVDRLVTMMVIAIVITWAGQITWLLMSRR